MDLHRFIVIGLIINASFAKSLNDQLKQSNTCDTEECKTLASSLKNQMNETVNPCDDFYKYACGNVKTNSSLLEQLLREPFTSILRPILDENTENGFQYEKKLRLFYRSCLDEEQLNKTSEKQFKIILDKLGGCPVLDETNQWRESNFNWTETVERLWNIGYPSNYFFSLSFAKCEDCSQKRIFQINVPRFFIGAENLRQGLKAPVVKIYFRSIINVFKLLGANKTVGQELKRALKFEIELAKLCGSEKVDHKILTIQELQLEYPDIQWLSFFNGILSPHIKINDTERIKIADPNYFFEFFRLMRDINLKETKVTNRDLANYVMYRVTFDSINQLSLRIRNAALGNYMDVASEESKSTFRKSICLETVHKKMHLASSALGVKRYFNGSVKNPVTHMFENIREGLGDLFTSYDWLDEITRKAALKRLMNISANIEEYPLELLDDKKLDQYYEEFTVEPENYLQTSLNYNIFQMKNNLEIIYKKRPNDSTEWANLYDPDFFTFQAKYYYMENQIYVSGNVLGKNFFNQNLPSYVNYGKLGTIISHEMMHAFDPQSLDLYEIRNSNKTWTEESLKRYMHMSQCVVEKYDNYTSNENATLHPVNGYNSLNENVADIGGLKAAYRAYRSALQENINMEPLLPGFENKTPTQMFWIAFASLYCSRRDDAIAFLDVNKSNPHPLEKYRVLGSITGSKDFANDFMCKLGDPMYPHETCDL